jgi:predicted nucleic acid-binding protein
VLSELSKKHPNSQVVAFLNTLPKNGMFISVITPGEIIKGIEKAKDEAIKKRFSSWYKKLCLWFEGKILDIDQETMVFWGKLVGNHKRTLPIIDSLLAATCLRRELVLVTRNTKDFNDIEGLSFINPWNHNEAIPASDIKS